MAESCLLSHCRPEKGMARRHARVGLANREHKAEGTRRKAEGDDVENQDLHLPLHATEPSSRIVNM